MEEQKKKVGDVIDQEMMDSAAGLEKIWHGSSVDFLLDRLETISRVMDEIADSEEISKEEGSIINMCYWQRDIISELRQMLDSHYRMILGLTRKFEITESEKEEVFTAGSIKLGALRGLADLFHHDKLFYSDTTDMAKLKCWAVAHGYDLDKVLSLLDVDKESCLMKVA